MKKILLLLVLVGNVAFAQKLTKDQLSEKLAEKACGCAEKQEITKDNFELTVGTNYFGETYLLDKLEKKLINDQTRVIIVSSLTAI